MNGGDVGKSHAILIPKAWPSLQQLRGLGAWALGTRMFPCARNHRETGTRNGLCCTVADRYKNYSTHTHFLFLQKLDTCESFDIFGQINYCGFKGISVLAVVCDTNTKI